LYAGQKIDGWLNTGSFFTIFLMFAALIGLAFKFYQMVSSLNSSKNEQDNGDNATS
jgi:hypothetical protein